MEKVIILFLLGIVSIVMLLQKIRPFREHFIEQQNNAPKMISILPSLQDSWIGVSLVSPNIGNNLQMTTSLPSRLWGMAMKNSRNADNYMISHITYCRDDMALLGCGAAYKDGKVDWKIYKKDNKNPLTEWKEIPSNEPICATLYDTDGILLGIHYVNGQIYKKKSTELKSEWKGPINFDEPMSRIYYDRDGIMIGIHQKNGKLYKKDGFLWNTDKWDSNIVNPQKIMDLVYDYDGCMIGITKDGLLKQKEPGFLSTFYPYNMKFKILIKEPMSFDEIIKARCGFLSSFDELVDIDHLDKELKDIIRFKKVQRSKCKNRSNLVRNAFRLDYENKDRTILQELENRNTTISELEDMVSRLRESL
jgi:hypothetical protein